MRFALFVVALTLAGCGAAPVAEAPREPEGPRPAKPLQASITRDAAGSRGERAEDEVRLPHLAPERLPPHEDPEARLQEAINAVRYARERLRADLHVARDPEPALGRLGEAIRDLERVQAGERVRPERTGGFPPHDWISGWTTIGGEYVPGGPPEDLLYFLDPLGTALFRARNPAVLRLREQIAAADLPPEVRDELAPDALIPEPPTPEMPNWVEVRDTRDRTKEGNWRLPRSPFDDPRAPLTWQDDRSPEAQAVD